MFNSSDNSLKSASSIDEYWDDLRVPLTTTRQGALSKPDFDTTNVGLLFPQNDATEIAYFITQLPHGYKHNTDLKPHVHWQQSAGTAVTWTLEYKIFKPGDAVPGAFTTLTGSTGVFTYVSGDLHQITPLGTITGGEQTSSIILGKLYRDDNTTTGDVLGFQIDIHYQTDVPGSRQEFIK